MRGLFGGLYLRIYLIINCAGIHRKETREVSEVLLCFDLPTLSIRNLPLFNAELC